MDSSLSQSYQEFQSSQDHDGSSFEEYVIYVGRNDLDDTHGLADILMISLWDLYKHMIHQLRRRFDDRNILNYLHPWSHIKVNQLVLAQYNYFLQSHPFSSSRNGLEKEQQKCRFFPTPIAIL